MEKDKSKPEYLKCTPEYFLEAWEGRKTFEIRKTRNRNFKVMGRIVLYEWGSVKKKKTGVKINAIITYIFNGPKYGIPKGVAVLSFRPTQFYIPKGQYTSITKRRSYAYSDSTKSKTKTRKTH